MSDQLAISACFSVLATGLLALAGPAFTSDLPSAVNALGATMEVAAPLLDNAQGFFALADLIR